MTEPEQTPQTSKPLVLLVEDEVLIRMATADALRDAGCIVVEAADAAQAIDAVNAGIKPHLVFTDVRMPGDVDGIALATRIQEMLPHVKVLITSGHLSGVDDQFRNNFVPKPYDPQHVVRRVMNALED